MPARGSLLRDLEGAYRMGVIGRLDDQVNEIIIKPVGERAGQAESQPQAPSKPVEPRPSNEAQENQTENEERPGERSPELPVWLL